MRIGISCNIQGQLPAPADGPDDFEEEFDKPETVEAIRAVLRAMGHEVEVLGDGPALVRRLLDRPPEFVFNFAEGTGISRSREARVPAVLEMLGIPYSGSDPLTLAVTLDKDCAKRLVQSAGVTTPKWITASAQCRARGAECADKTGRSNWKREAEGVVEQVAAAGIGFPLIAKPAYEGSSKGIRAKSLVETPDQLISVLSDLTEYYRQPVLVEEFISGDEVTVGVVGNDPPEALGMMQILPVQPSDRFIYSLEVKRDYRGQVRYQAPPDLPGDLVAELEQAALAAYRVLGCRDLSRIDFRLQGRKPYFLEVNPLPGLHPQNSDLVLMAAGYGITHAELVRRIFTAACDRLHLASGLQV